MDGIYFYVIAFILIWLIAIVFKSSLERYGVEVSFPLLMWRTKRLHGFIDKLAKWSPRFWKAYMNIGIAVSVFFMVFMAVALVYSLTTIIDTPSVSLILPGVDVPGSPIHIPLVEGLIALATVLVIHEFSHGILARVENIKLESIGLLLFAVLPGAFVEPDEEELEALPKPSQLRILSAGSIANLSLAAIALIIMTILSSFILPAVFVEDGVEIQSLTDDGNAIKYLSEGMIIKSIDNYTFDNSTGYMDAVSTLRPNNTVTVGTDHGNYSFKLKTNPNNSSLGYMGVQAQLHYVLTEQYDNQPYSFLLWGLMSLKDLFFWIFFLNFAVGTFNLLPMKPLDGGKIFEILLSYVSSENIYKPLTAFMSYFMGIIIVFSLIYGFVGALI